MTRPYDEELEFSLWMSLICSCDECGTVHWLFEFNDLLERDPIAWSKAVTPVVQSAGWTAPDQGDLLCPSCTAKRISR
jgi:hypothetical protein